MEGTFRLLRLELANRRRSLWIDGAGLPKRRSAFSLESEPESRYRGSCGLQRPRKGYPDRASRPADFPRGGRENKEGPGDHSVCRLSASEIPPRLLARVMACVLIKIQKLCA